MAEGTNQIQNWDGPRRIPPSDGHATGRRYRPALPTATHLLPSWTGSIPWVACTHQLAEVSVVSFPPLAPCLWASMRMIWPYAINSLVLGDSTLAATNAKEQWSQVSTSVTFWRWKLWFTDEPKIPASMTLCFRANYRAKVFKVNILAYWDCFHHLSLDRLEGRGENQGGGPK